MERWLFYGATSVLWCFWHLELEHGGHIKSSKTCSLMDTKKKSQKRGSINKTVSLSYEAVGADWLLWLGYYLMWWHMLCTCTCQHYLKECQLCLCHYMHTHVCIWAHTCALIACTCVYAARAILRVSLCRYDLTPSSIYQSMQSPQQWICGSVLH